MNPILSISIFTYVCMLMYVHKKHDIKLQVIDVPGGEDIVDGVRKHVVLLSDILHHTLTQEENDPKVVSFSVRGAYYSNFNVRFRSEFQARQFVTTKKVAFSSRTKIRWARIYTNWRPVIMTYEYEDNGDLGFKLLDNQNYPNLNERLHHLRYLFRRSEIKNAIKTSPPQTLYLRNGKRWEDYEIQFQNRDNLGTFLKLFPNRECDQLKTLGYYFIPFQRESE